MNQIIQVNSPIIFFDIESTGTDTRKDRIVELSTIKITPDGKQEIITQRFNPGIPIPEAATAVHGIRDEDVINEPSFSEKAQEIYNYFLGCDLGGYNIVNFDIRMLTEELLRADVDLPFNSETKIIDAMVIFKNKEKRDLAAAYKFYYDKELTNAHQAETNTLAALEIIQGQINKYGFEADIESLAEMSKFDKDSVAIDYAGNFIKNADGDIVFNFSKDIKAKKLLKI